MSSGSEKRVDIVVRGGNSSYYHKVWNNGAFGPSTTGYTNLGGQWIFDPVSVLWGPDRLYVFGVGYDSTVYFRSLNKTTGVWGAAWTAISGGGRKWGANPSVVALYPSTMELIAYGPDNALYHTTWRNGKWEEFSSLGGYFRNPPEVVSLESSRDRFDIFALGLDGHIYHKWWVRGRGAGTGWLPKGKEGNYEDLDGPFTDTPKAIARGEDRIDLVVMSRGGVLRHKTWDGDAWTSSWSAIETTGVPVGRPELISLSPDRLDLFYIGQDRATYHKTLKDSGGWEKDLSLGGISTGDQFAAAGTGGDVLHVFHIGRELTLYYKSWAAKGGWASGYQHLGGTIFGGVSVGFSQAVAYNP